MSVDTSNTSADGFHIRRLHLYLLRAPIAKPITTSFGAMTARSAVLVRIEDQTGAHGWGEAWCNFPSCAAEHRYALLEQVIAPLILGKRFSNAEEVSDWLNARTAVLTLQAAEPGPFSQVIAAVNTACADLAARQKGMPLHRMLGSRRDRVPAYASGINPDGALQTIERARAQSYRSFKLKVGFDPSRDLENIREISEGLSEGETLMVDANQAWRLEQARLRCADLSAFNLAWVEEPLRADAPPEHWLTLARESPAPLAAGENLIGLPAFQSVIQQGDIGVIQPDVAKWGGVSGCLTVARAALNAGRRYCPHFLGAAVGLAASAHLLAAAGGEGLLEVDINDNPLRESLTASPLPLKSGAYHLTEAPGLGVEPDPAALEQFKLFSCTLA